MIIRPTASLAKRMKVKLHSTTEASGCRLGDWYAVDFVLDKKQFILCVSSASRLAVVIEAAPYLKFPHRICDAVTGVLRAIGVKEQAIQEERAHMNDFVLAKTENKSILGTLNEYRFQLEAYAQAGRIDLTDTLKMSMYLSKVISLVLPDGYPKHAALRLFGQEPPPNQGALVSVPTSFEPKKSKLHLVK